MIIINKLDIVIAAKEAQNNKTFLFFDFVIEQLYKTLGNLVVILQTASINSISIHKIEERHCIAAYTVYLKFPISRILALFRNSIYLLVVPNGKICWISIIGCIDILTI